MNDKGLGKGLDALLPEAEANDDELRQIPVDQIEPDPDQPRQHFDQERLDELTQSIEQQGLVEPVVVRPRDDDFVLVAGERRWRASCQAGLDRIPALIRNLSAADALAVSLIENIQRENLTDVEEARAYRRLMNEQDWNQQDLADNVGRSRSAVANQLRLLKLPDTVLEGLNDGQITAGHARCLLALASTDEMLEAYQQIIDDQLSVRRTEQLVQAWPPDPAEQTPAAESPDSTPDNDFGELESSLENAIGAAVTIDSEDRKKGHIKIHFNNPDEFEMIRERFETLGTD